MDIGSITNLGTGGFALLIMWWMFKDSGSRLDKKEEAFRALEKEVRDKILYQLADNTKAFERVIRHFESNNK